MSRVFRYEERFVWGPLLVVCFLPSVVAMLAGLPDQTVGGIVLFGGLLSAPVSVILENRHDRRHPQPDS